MQLLGINELQVR